MDKLRIGLLNFAVPHRPKDYLKEIQELVDYARLADELGFSRFWLAEHLLFRKKHTWTSPDMLLPLLASSTGHIRIGIAGTLISIHKPIDIAMNYKMLANLFPGRIDLGLAKGGDGSGSGPGDVFAENARVLIRYLKREESLFSEGLVIPPYGGEVPEVWLLGSSYRSVGFALELGANFSRSIFHPNHDPHADTGRLEDYLASFRGQYGTPPGVSLAMAACCHEDSGRAKDIAEECLRSSELTLEKSGIFVGSPHELLDRIHALHRMYEVSEFILLQLYRNQEDRLRGIELIAKVFDLQPSKDFIMAV
ncbi:MAG TPA: LLM class flavin-dependent oxidoreductase [Puia sp.]|nr:LLM class flavin-dependent oxidoreductase [Puia sp.]